jgi:hypothetical protein
MYPIVDASAWPVRSVETEGLDEKYWLANPADESRWLFKAVKVHSHLREGEDWAEKIASEVARLLQIPAAEVAMASWQDREGCLSRDVRPDPELWQHHSGSVLLSELVPDYDRRARGAVGHSLFNIAESLRGCLAPPDFAGPPENGGVRGLCGLSSPGRVGGQHGSSQQQLVCDAV